MAPLVPVPSAFPTVSNIEPVPGGAASCPLNIARNEHDTERSRPHCPTVAPLSPAALQPATPLFLALVALCIAPGTTTLLPSPPGFSGPLFGFAIPPSPCHPLLALLPRLFSLSVPVPFLCPSRLCMHLAQQVASTSIWRVQGVEWMVPLSLALSPFPSARHTTQPYSCHCGTRGPADGTAGAHPPPAHL